MLYIFLFRKKLPKKLNNSFSTFCLCDPYFMQTSPWIQLLIFIYQRCFIVIKYHIYCTSSLFFQQYILAPFRIEEIYLCFCNCNSLVSRNSMYLSKITDQVSFLFTCFRPKLVNIECEDVIMFNYHKVKGL